MAQQEKITIVDCDDLGPVMARADHQNRVIEVNRKVFYGLPPMVQEFVLCHEVCHLRHNEHDEARTNQLAAELFMQRAQNDADRRARADFLAYLYGKEGSHSNWVATVIAAVSAAFGIGTTVWGIVKDRNAGWYSWDSATQRTNMNALLRQSFEQSRRTSKESAAQILWAQLSKYTNKDSSLKQFLERSDNSWVNALIAKYEKKYGFGFDEVTPIDLRAFPLVIVAVGALLAFAVYKIIKNRK